MSIQPQLSNDETIEKLNAFAKEKGDAFKVKVYRVRSPAVMPEQVLGLNNVTVAHIASPEQWLSKLVGGGPVFQLYVYHMSDSTLPVQGTSRLIFNIGGAAKECDHAQTLDPRYDGPREIYFPDVPKLGFPSATFNIPAPAGALSSVPQSQVPGGNSSGLGSSSVVTQDLYARDREALAQERAALVAREQAMTQRLHAIELEAMRREHDSKFAALQAQIAQQLSRPPDHAKLDVAGIVTAISGALAPIIGAVLTGQQQSRVEMLKIQHEQATQHQALLAKLLERPGVDPQVKEAQDRLFSVLEKQMTAESPNTKMLTSVSEAMGNVMGLYGEAIKTLTDLQGGEKEPVGMMVMRELVKGINAVANGVASSAKGRRVPVPVPRALPNGGHTAPAPAGFAGAPPSVPPPPSNGNPKIVDELEAAIRARVIPSQVAAAFVQALQDPYLNAALDEVGRDPLKLFQARLGKWAGEHPLNMQYVQQLAAELQRQLSASGVQFQPDPPEEPLEAEASEEEGEEDEELEDEELEEGEEEGEEGEANA